MHILKGLARLRLGLPAVLHTPPQRLKVTAVEKVVGWKYVNRPSQLTPQYCGDLAPGEQVDLKQPQLVTEAAKDVLESADPVTQRVLSLEFARSREQTTWLQNRAVRHVQRHRFDTESPEATVARLTAKIRRYQELLSRPENTQVKHLRRLLMESTQKRNSQLRRLRAVDYRRFEWLLEELQLVYRPLLPTGTSTSLTRKTGIRQLVQLHCDNIRQQKLDALRRQYDAEKPAFLEERRRAAAWIAAEERELGVPLTVDEEKGELLEPRLPKMLVVPPFRPESAAA